MCAERGIPKVSARDLLEKITIPYGVFGGVRPFYFFFLLSGMLIYLSGIYRRTEGTVFSEAETQKKREKKAVRPISNYPTPLPLLSSLSMAVGYRNT